MNKPITKEQYLTRNEEIALEKYPAKEAYNPYEGCHYDSNKQLREGFIVALNWRDEQSKKKDYNRLQKAWDASRSHIEINGLKSGDGDAFRKFYDQLNKPNPMNTQERKTPEDLIFEAYIRKDNLSIGEYGIAAEIFKATRLMIREELALSKEEKKVEEEWTYSFGRHPEYEETKFYRDGVVLHSYDFSSEKEACNYCDKLNGKK